MTGTDDQCGATVQAAASGTAHQNPNGTISLSIAVTRPDGRLLQTNASVSLPSIAGTWDDNYGNGGTFVFDPAAPAGAPRRITVRGTYAINYQAAGAGHNGISSFSFGDTMTIAPVAPSANFILEGQAATANCPGTSAFPLAAPGHLCVYERTATNVAASRCVARVGTSFNCDAAERYGAAVFVEAVASGNVASQGAWAVTIP